jgi:hypothetical protein
MGQTRLTPLVQGVYFIGTGLWPVVHLPSFEAVTGPKLEKWLVRTFGALVAAVGSALVVGATGRGAGSRVLVTLGVGSALALGLADGIYVAKGRIRRVYLLDLVAEGAILGAWVLEGRRRGTEIASNPDLVADAGSDRSCQSS